MLETPVLGESAVSSNIYKLDMILNKVIKAITNSFRPYFYQNSRLPRTYRVLHPSEICSYIQEHYPQRHRGADLYPGPGGAAAPSSAPLLAYGTTRQHFAAATTGERKLIIFYNTLCAWDLRQSMS